MAGRLWYVSSNCFQRYSERMESDRYSPRKRCSELNNSTSNFGEAGVELEPREYMRDLCYLWIIFLPSISINSYLIIILSIATFSISSENEITKLSYHEIRLYLIFSFEWEGKPDLLHDPCNLWMPKIILFVWLFDNWYWNFYTFTRVKFLFNL